MIGLAKKRYSWWLALLLVGGLGLGFKTAGDYFEISKNMEIFGKLFTEVNTVYVDETNPTELMRTGIDAMLQNLDPYTNFYSESQIEESKIMSTGQYSGIGAAIGLRRGKLMVLELYENGPADQAGLRVGDELIGIDQERFSQPALQLEQARNLLLGEKGSQIMIRIKRANKSDESSLTITRGGTSVQQENVPFYGMATDDIGYILLSGFMADAGREVAEAAKKLKADNPELKAYILDLRGNPGGRLDQAVEVSNVFLPEGEFITEMKGRTRESKQKFYTLKAPVNTEIPLAVLVNSGSASASEIVSGSIQDLDRGVIIGQRSFGKGLVQNVLPLSYNTQMKVTIARYFTPSGRCIQAIDYSQRNADGSVGRVADSLVKAFKTRNGRTVYDGGGVDPDLAVPLSPTPPIAKALNEQGLIFDFVTDFAQKNEEISSPREFKISDALYQEFVEYVSGRDFAFDTKTDQQVKQFEKLLGKADMAADMQEEVAALKERLVAEKNRDLTRHQQAISKLLHREIINRYYFKQGVLEASFVGDPVLLEAIEVLNDPPAYSATLSGKK